MDKLQFRTRNLKTGEAGTHEVLGTEAAEAWLRARPKGLEVVGLGSWGIAPELSTHLRECARPLDPDEILMRGELEAGEAKRRAEAEAKRALEQDKAREAHKQAMRTADPNRPMQVHYVYSKGLSLTDPDDPRTLTDEAKAAVEEWIAERTDWVKDRGQIVGEANVTVYPGPVPKGKDRIVEGTFFPVTA